MQTYWVIQFIFYNGMTRNFYANLGGYFISSFINGMVSNFLENIIDLMATIISLYMMDDGRMFLFFVVRISRIYLLFSSVSGEN